MKNIDRMKDEENEMEEIQRRLEQFADREAEEMNGMEEEAEYDEDNEEEAGEEAEDEYGDEEEDDEEVGWKEEEEWEGKKRRAKGRKKGKMKKEHGERRKNDGMRQAPSGSGGKRKKKKSGLKKLVIFLLVLFMLFFGALYLLVGIVYGKMNHSEPESLAGEPLKAEGVTSILLIGSDSRTSGDEGRSDAMILLTISDKTRTVHMTSLLRDMYVEIPGHDGNRLNAAYAYGGAELLLETVNQNFGLDVNRYAVVNFEAFANLVDAVDGVELELTNEEVGWVNAYLNEYNLLRDMPLETDYLDTSLSGMIHLNGAQALAYCRNRYIGTDFGRTQRQRNVLAAVMKKLPAAMVTNPGELINGLFPNLTTNLTQTECMGLSLTAWKLLAYELVQDSIPLEGTYSNATIREMAVLQVDFDRNKEYIRKEIYGE